MTQAERERRIGVSVLGCGFAVLVGLAFLALVGTFTLHRLQFLADVGPGTGTHSRRLPITVAPATELRDGAVVRVTSREFDADSVVGVTVCLREAIAKNEGVDACDRTSGARYATDGESRLDATFAVPRVITVGGKAHDCAATPAPCMVVAAAASNFDESGGQPIRFHPGLPAVPLIPKNARAGSDRLPIVAVPIGPVAPGTLLNVTARGFQPGEPLLVARCAGFPAAPPERSCEPLELNDALQALLFGNLQGAHAHAAADGTFTTTVPAAATVSAMSDSAATSCRREPGGCTIVIAAAADVKRSAVLPYALTTG